MLILEIFMSLLLPYTEIFCDITCIVSSMNRVSITTCTMWSRLKFVPLVSRNIKIQNYPKHLIEWIVLGDEEISTMNAYEKSFADLREMGVTCKYYSCSIENDLGKKRNDAVSKTSNQIVSVIDDDDILASTFISYSVECLLKNNLGLVGANDMLVIYPMVEYTMMYIKGSKIHEATMTFTKDHWVKYKFTRGMTGEGCGLLHGMYDNELDIKKLMICVSHDNNTYSKSGILAYGKEIPIGVDQKERIRELLNNHCKLDFD